MSRECRAPHVLFLEPVECTVPFVECIAMHEFVKGRAMYEFVGQEQLLPETVDKDCAPSDGCVHVAQVTWGQVCDELTEVCEGDLFLALVCAWTGWLYDECNV